MKYVGPPQPFRLMLHPTDALLRLFAFATFIVLVIVRFGWMDGGLIVAAVWAFAPYPPRVPYLGDSE